MDQKGKKEGLINKTWQRCKSLGRRGSHNHKTGVTATADGAISPAMTRGGAMKKKSKSWPRMATIEDHQRRRVAPEGCFTVYVGPQKQRFVVKTEYANHPLFKMLLDEAESEFGYDTQGPLVLPCHVDMFYKVIMEMDDDDDGTTRVKIHPGCGFTKRGHGSNNYHLLSPSRMLAINQF